MNISLSELKKLAEAATPEWFRAGRPDMQSYDAMSGVPFKALYNDDISPKGEAGHVYGDNSVADSQLIAAAKPATVLKLIEMIELRDNLLKRYRAACNCFDRVRCDQCCEYDQKVKDE